MPSRARTSRGLAARRAFALFFLLAAAAASGLSAAPAKAAHVVEDSADRMIFWTGCDDLVATTDAELDAWQEMGVDGFVCQSQWLRGLGGTQDFTSDPNASLATDNYALQRELRDSRIVERAEARGMKLYLGVYFVNYFNHATPLADWFDDARWAQLLPKLRNISGAARMLGFAGLAIDQELYGQQGGAQDATWAWDFPGNTRPEAEVRSKAEQRGQEVMDALLGGYPGVDILLYNFPLPDSWNEIFAEQINDRPDAYDDLLHLDFWDGMTSVEGYGAIRYINHVFQKSTHVGASWENAFAYDSNQLFALLSRSLSNWDYAASHFSWSPFSWINAGPNPGTYDDPKPPAYVAKQLDAIRKWGMSGEFANFVYGRLELADYEPYTAAMQAASRPGGVDGVAPTLAIDGWGRNAGRPAIEGTARDNLAIRAVYWHDDRGGSGTADLTWKVRRGGFESNYDWVMQWSIPAAQVSAGARRLVINAEDIKGHASKEAPFRWDGVPKLDRKPPRRLTVNGRRAKVRFGFVDSGQPVRCGLDRRKRRACGSGSVAFKIPVRREWTQHVFELAAVGAPGGRRAHGDLLRYRFEIKRR